MKIKSSILQLPGPYTSLMDDTFKTVNIVSMLRLGDVRRRLGTMDEVIICNTAFRTVCVSNVHLPHLNKGQPACILGVIVSLLL